MHNQMIDSIICRTGDILTSLVKPLNDIGHLSCYFYSGEVVVEDLKLKSWVFFKLKMLHFMLKMIDFPRDWWPESDTYWY